MELRLEAFNNGVHLHPVETFKVSMLPELPPQDKENGAEPFRGGLVFGCVLGREVFVLKVVLFEDEITELIEMGSPLQLEGSLQNRFRKAAHAIFRRCGHA